MFEFNERVKEMSGLELMKKRIATRGATIDDRLVRDKFDSYQKAVERGYQAEWITLLDENGQKTDNRWRCLINPSRLTEQFDKKVISIDYIYDSIDY